MRTAETRRLVRSGRFTCVVALATAGILAAACAPPTTTPPPSVLPAGLSIVVGGTLADPQPGGQIELSEGSPVRAADIPTANMPAAALGDAALTTLLASAPLRTADPAAAPLRTAEIASLPLRTADSPPVLLSTVPLTEGRRWQDLLAGTTLDATPIQNVTLNAVSELAAAGGAPQLAALTLADLDLSASPLRTASVASIALGNSTLDDLPGQSPPEADPFATTWCPWIAEAGLDCGSFSGSSTLMSLDIAGAPLRTAPLRTAPLRTADLMASPLRTAPLRTADLSASPLRTAPLRTAVLAAAPLRTAPLRTALLASSPLRTAPLRTADQTFLPQVVDCSAGSGVDCSTTSTQTLDDVINIDADRILGSATLETFFSAFPAAVTDAFTLGDLKEYGNATIGDIQPGLPTTITIADAILAVIPRASLQWEAVPYSQLQLGPLGATPPVTVTARFTVAADHDAESSVRVQLPPEAVYLPSATQLVTATGQTFPVGVVGPTVEGELELPIPTEAPAGAASIGFRMTAIEPLTAPLSFESSGIDTSGGGSSTASVTVPVVDAEAGQTYPTPTLHDGDLSLGVIASSGEVDSFEVPVPATPGAVTDVSISHLDGDFDLVASKPSGQPPVSSRGFRSNGLKQTPLESTDPELRGIRQTLDPQTQKDLQLGSLDAADVASSSYQRGLTDERVRLVSQPGDQGVYRFRVSGYNGASSTRPYLIVVRQSVPSGSGVCVRPAPTAAAATSTGSITAATKSLFLVNRQRMVDTYGQPAYDAMLAKLEAVSARPEVGGSIVYVDGDTGVRSAYGAWDAASCDPAKANDVVAAINSLVDALLDPVAGTTPWHGLTSITIVGADDMIPMARVADNTASSNEAGYAAEVQRTDVDGAPVGPSPLSAALATRHLLTDDAYASWQPIAWRDSVLFLPDVALGRLVEKPSEITVALNAYDSSATGRLDASTSLTTGYDFMADAATQIDAALPSATQRQQLISDTWDATQLNNLLYGVGDTPRIGSLNAHFDHQQLLPALGNATGDQSALVTTKDVADHPGRLAGRLIFSMGCHSGLSVPDGYLSGSLTVADAPESPTPLPGETPAQTRARLSRLDWAEAFANDGATYIGNTGYGYGDTATVAFSERLMGELASLLNGSVSAGQALSYAKHAYYGSLAAFSDYDQKVLMEAVFYGLPFWGVGDATATPPPPPGVPTTPVPGAPSLSIASAGIGPNIATHQTPKGVVYSADGKAPTVVDGQPIVARTSIDVTPTDPSLELHGYVITGLSSTDDLDVRSAFGKPVIDLAAKEPAVPARDAAFPSTLQSTQVLDTPAGERQIVNLNVSQFRDGSEPGVGTVRRFTSVQGEALYSPTGTSDGLTPTAASSTAMREGGSLRFTVKASDLEPGSTPGSTQPGSIHRVAVMYKDGADWHPLDLARSGPAGGTETWTATAATPATDVDWFAQVVDEKGNVAVTSNKATNFRVSPADPPRITTARERSVTANTAVTFDGTFATNAPDPAYTGTIDFGDGSATEPLSISVVGGAATGEFTSTAHPYATVGTATARISICTSVGACTTTTTTVVVGPQPPITLRSERLSAGSQHTCALTDADGVKCWGSNSNGKLGDGTTTSSSTPVDVVGLATGVKAISSGEAHTCALTDAGTVQCWGYNADGELGDGGTTSSSTPVDVEGLANVKAIASGLYNTCALTIAGDVRCWGDNGTGQLGDGTTTSSSTPVDVVGLAPNVRAIVAGGRHMCALSDAGAVKCWGSDLDGQLGDGGTTSSSTPVDVVGLASGVKAIYAGTYHTCAVTDAGTVKCWGYNDDGELGDGTTIGKLTPVDVVGLASGVSAVTGGEAHTCALTAAGAVKCWGYNADGQVGDGTTIGRLTPVDVIGLASGVNAVDAGLNHTCATTEPGAVKCWGLNGDGQLGDGTTTGSTTPVDVVGF